MRVPKSPVLLLLFPAKAVLGKRHGRRPRKCRNENMALLGRPEYQGELPGGWNLVHLKMKQIQPPVLPQKNTSPFRGRQIIHRNHSPCANPIREICWRHMPIQLDIAVLGFQLNKGVMANLVQEAWNIQSKVCKEP